MAIFYQSQTNIITVRSLTKFTLNLSSFVKSRVSEDFCNLRPIDFVSLSIENGHFLVIQPACLRQKFGGSWVAVELIRFQKVGVQ